MQRVQDRQSEVIPTEGSNSNPAIVSESKTSVRHVPSTVFGLMLRFAGSRELYKIQRVAKQFQKLGTTELQTRSVLTYKSNDVGARVSEIRIFYDYDQIAILAKTKDSHVLLPIKDHKNDLRNKDVFHFSKNQLNIMSMVLPFDYEKDCLEIIFPDHTASLAYSFPPAPELTPPAQDALKLIDAVNENDIPKVAAELLKPDANASTRNREGVPLLVHAAYHGDLEIVKLLVRHRANIEARSPEGQGQLNALLTSACYIGSSIEKKETKHDSKHENKQKDVMMFLIKKQADIKATSRTGRTLFHYLVRAEMDNTEVINLLLSRGLNPAHRNLHGRRPVDFYMRSDSLAFKNSKPLYAATIHSTPTLYCKDWSRLEDGSGYLIHFNSNAWTTQKNSTLDAIASKLKSVKTEDPVPGGLGLAHDFMHVGFLDAELKHHGDLPIPDCINHALQSVMFVQNNLLKISIAENYWKNAYVHTSIQKAFLDLKLCEGAKLQKAEAKSMPAPARDTYSGPEKSSQNNWDRFKKYVPVLAVVAFGVFAAKNNWFSKVGNIFNPKPC